MRDPLGGKLNIIPGHRRKNTIATKIDFKNIIYIYYVILTIRFYSSILEVNAGDGAGDGVFDFEGEGAGAGEGAMALTGAGAGAGALVGEVIAVFPSCINFQIGAGFQKYITIPTTNANTKLCTAATIVLDPLAGILMKIPGVIIKNKATIKKNLKTYIIYY